MAWSGGLAEWIEGDTTFISVAFTYKLGEAYARAQFARAQGMKVRAGGPALFLKQNRRELEEIATVGGDYPEAVTKHNPDATFASRGCPVDCSFCIVPAMEGRNFTLIPEFVPRPYLCDSNLSGLPADYQSHIIRRYAEAGVRMIDAQSGFEPRTFTPDVYERWKPLINVGQGPWRFAYDEMLGDRGREERSGVLRVMRMLAGERSRRKQVYVLIGNEPFAECMQRIREVIDNGCEPHVQAFMKLNARERKPWVRFDWTERNLQLVARWANLRAWKYCDFAAFDPKLPGHIPEAYDAQQGLFG